MPINPEHIRMVEALLFAAKEPVDELVIASRLSEEANIFEILKH